MSGLDGVAAALNRAGLATDRTVLLADAPALTALAPATRDSLASLAAIHTPEAEGCVPDLVTTQIPGVLYGPPDLPELEAAVVADLAPGFGERAVAKLCQAIPNLRVFYLAEGGLVEEPATAYFTDVSYRRRALDRLLRDARPTEILRQSPGGNGPPRVLHVIYSLHQGGTERECVNTVTALSGVAPTLEQRVACESLCHGGDHFAGTLTRQGVPVMEAPQAPRALSRAPLADAAVPWIVRYEIARIVDAIEACQPDLLHIWLSSHNALIAGLMSGVRRCITYWPSLTPDTWVRHGITPAGFADYLRDYQAVAARSGRVTSTVNSAAAVADYEAWLGVDGYRVDLVANALDTAAWTRPDAAAVAELRTQFGIPHGVPVAGGMMRLEPEKDPELWFAAAERLARDGMFCVLFGEGPLDHVLEDLRDGCDQKERIVIAGPTDDPGTAYGLFDVLLLTSRIEGMPNVLLEAQLLGVPVVTSDVGGCAECLLEGRTGFVADNRDPETFAHLARRCIADETWRQAVAGTARPFIEARFGADLRARQTLNSYGL